MWRKCEKSGIESIKRRKREGVMQYLRRKHGHAISNIGENAAKCGGVWRNGESAAGAANGGGWLAERCG